jgi:hypothetical protein
MLEKPFFSITKNEKLHLRPYHKLLQSLVFKKLLLHGYIVLSKT